VKWTGVGRTSFDSVTRHWIRGQGQKNRFNGQRKSEPSLIDRAPEFSIRGGHRWNRSGNGCAQKRRPEGREKSYDGVFEQRGDWSNAAIGFMW